VTTFFSFTTEPLSATQTTLTVDGQELIPVQRKQLSQKVGLTTYFNSGPQEVMPPSKLVNTCIVNALSIHSWERKNPVQHKRSHEEGKGTSRIHEVV